MNTANRFHQHMQKQAQSDVPNDQPENDPYEKLLDLDEQGKADLLESVDNMIAAHTRKIEILQDYKKGLMQKMNIPIGGTTDEHGNFWKS